MHFSLTSAKFSHTQHLQDCELKMHVLSQIVHIHSLCTYATSALAVLHFDPCSLCKCVSKFHHLGMISDLAMHLHIKLPDKKNDANLYCG